jgi:hypothetical protein
VRYQVGAKGAQRLVGLVIFCPQPAALRVLVCEDVAVLDLGERLSVCFVVGVPSDPCRLEI